MLKIASPRKRVHLAAGLLLGSGGGDEYKSQGEGKARVRFLSFPSLLLPPPTRPTPPFATTSPSLITRSVILRPGRGGLWIPSRPYYPFIYSVTVSYTPTLVWFSECNLVSMLFHRALRLSGLHFEVQ
ncbi:uncharacterized protein SCHCODRAFT_02519961 [Schizophyllum commune H4-8]|nr:uncharacterized protein SCHCODRAFT_02519961 [Schizophyllum commune H4-8]KAI5885581.1 hypothetical protein SCHCODRAFT_02519961 [Schizophyllum commune H4-8]